MSFGNLRIIVDTLMNINTSNITGNKTKYHQIMVVIAITNGTYCWSIRYYEKPHEERCINGYQGIRYDIFM